MKKTKRLFLFILVFPVLVGAVKYPVIDYRTSDGLPQNQVNALIQDQLGYIYVGTQSGIGKFDGSGFETLTKKNGLPNNFINDFEMDREGNIWVATQEGLAKIDKNSQITGHLPTEFILSLHMDKKTDTLWILTRKGVYYSKGESFVPYRIPGFSYEENNENIPRGMVIGNLGMKYFYWDNQIAEIDGDKVRTRTLRGNHTINCLKCLDNIIVIGTTRGLFSMQSVMGPLKSPGDDKKPRGPHKDALESGDATPWSDGPSWAGRAAAYLDLPGENTNVIDVVSDENGKTWVGTSNGLLFYNSPTEPPVIITDKNGLSARAIKTILIDRENNLFVGTEWGLSQLSTLLFKMYDETDGLPHKFVWDFEEDNDTILISCDQGIVELDPVTGIITPFTSVNRYLKNYSIRAIVKYGEKDFLLGTRGHGIFRWDRKDKVERIYEKANVTSAVKGTDSPHMVWFGTENGLLKYDGERFTFLREGLKDKTIWALDVYDRDTLFVGTGKGVQKCFKEEFVPSELEKRINRDTVINDIKVVSPSEIFVATELKGLYIYKDNRLEQLTTADGLSHNDIWAVIKDGTGNIWVNTSISLDRYTHGFVSHFNKKTGLFGEEGGIHATFKASSGKIYLGLIPGFIEIPVHGTVSEDKIKKPILYVKEIKVMGQAIPVDPNRSLRLDLKYNQNNLEFDYIAVSTRKDKPVFYKTRLVPFDNDWSEPTKETRIKYLNLPADDYLFQVTANNGGGEDQWFESINQITLVVSKPFWLTWWFILLALILAIFLVFLLIRIRLNALEKQKKILEKQVEERTEQLKYLSITDPLTDLKNRRYLEEKIKEDIGRIERYIYDSKKSPQQPLYVPILGVFILDIDHFKKVNDQYGHKAGDIVIVDIARLLLEMLRHSDTIVRWGGEEFLVITWQKDMVNSFDLAERIRKKIESYTFVIDENTKIHKTVSVGFAHFPFLPNETQLVTWPQVVSLADSALYIAKNNGRNLSIGIESGERINELDMNFKVIVSNIRMGLKKKYLRLVGSKNNLTISQLKT